MQIFRFSAFLTKLCIIGSILSVLLIYAAPIISQVTTHSASSHQSMKRHQNALNHHQSSVASDKSQLINHWCDYCKLLYQLSWYRYDAMTVFFHSEQSLALIETIRDFHVYRWITTFLHPRAPPHLALS